MAINKFHYKKNYNNDPGVPASPSRFPLIVRGRKTVGLMVADKSFLRSLCRSLCPNGFLPCGLSATIANAKQFPLLWPLHHCYILK